MAEPEAIIIRPLQAIDEFEACVALQREVWRFSEADLVPRRMFVVADKIGGQILGAWAGTQLAGYTMALPGLKPDGGVYWHSHMLAVGAEYRNRGVGRGLKLRQRQEALAGGIGLIEWTFDPLEIKNAYFNIVRLGAIARRYVANQYGMSSSRLQAGLPTDRLIAEWWLREERPQAAIAATVTVPAAIGAWKAAGDERAAALQKTNRDALQGAFAAGLTVVDYQCGPEGEGVFRLGRAPEYRL